MLVMILFLVWRGVPLSIILQLGDLQTIGKDLYEAAAIDGASRWQVLRYITIPQLKPILLINAILATAGTPNHVDIPIALTGGGPGRATEVLARTGAPSRAIETEMLISSIAKSSSAAT